MQHRPTIQRGVLHVGDQPLFLLTADYPYYRDRVDQWEPRLRQLKELGILIVTAYTPWRHHEVDGRLDFTGETAPNRNVVRFLTLCQQLGLQVVIKPGPFIHAETDYGGLPDRLDPTQDPDMEPVLDCAGDLYLWHRPLPAPLSRRWQSEVAAWFRAVREAVIEPHRYPDGPIIALQVLNEGIYSDANRSFTSYDYSPSALAHFNANLAAKGYACEAPRTAPALSAQSAAAGARPHLEWALNLSQYLNDVYKFGAAELLTTGLPLLSNMHPPDGAPQGLDWWLCKVNPEDWGPVVYGFTNWIGVVSHDPTAFYRYLVLVKRGIGPNLEENWGFSELYDSRYRHTVIPFFQTLLAMAAGTTGFNVYTGVGTDDWDDQLDTRQHRPYPDTAPIGADGTLHPKAHTLRLLAKYINRWGTEWLACSSRQDVHWAIYPPYSALAGWDVAPEAWRRAGVEPPVGGVGGLDGFMRTMRAENRDFGLINVMGDEPSPTRTPALVMVGGFFMDAATQQRLLDYVRAGGHLIIARELPRLDADLVTPCTILADSLGTTAQGRLTLVEGNPFTSGLTTASVSFLQTLTAIGFTPEIRTDGAETQAWVRRHPETDVAHVVVLSLADTALDHTVAWEGHELVVTLPGHSAALVRLAGGRVSTALVKGINDCDRQQAVPTVRFAGETLRASGPGDWLWIQGEGDELIPWDW